MLPSFTAFFKIIFYRHLFLNQQEVIGIIWFKWYLFFLCSFEEHHRCCHSDLIVLSRIFKLWKQGCARRHAAWFYFCIFIHCVIRLVGAFIFRFVSTASTKSPLYKYVLYENNTKKGCRRNKNKHTTKKKKTEK